MAALSNKNGLHSPTYPVTAAVLRKTTVVKLRIFNLMIEKPFYAFLFVHHKRIGEVGLVDMCQMNKAVALEKVSQFSCPF
jgi:hypothetical protein